MKIGDKVRVFAVRKDTEPPYREHRSCIHRGVVTALTTSHAQVWDTKSETDHPGKGSWFPFRSKNLWLEPA